MAYNDILLHIEGHPDVTSRRAIDAAIAITKTLGGRASALAVELRIAYRPNLLIDPMLGLKTAAEETEQLSVTTCRDGIAYFRRRAQREGVFNETRTLVADLGVGALRRAEAARSFDFSIYCPATDRVDKLLAETLLLVSGRPLLILPDGHGGEMKSALVAWDGSAQAARSMNEALPLLRRMQQVKVLTLGAEGGAAGITGPAMAVRHLMRHGVAAERLQVDPEGQGIGASLDVQSGLEGVDVVVMGAFGHSRLREIILGGVTEHMLSQPPTAVWLSH